MTKHLSRSIAFVVIVSILGIGAALLVSLLRMGTSLPPAPTAEEIADLQDDPATRAGTEYVSDYGFLAWYPDGYVPDEDYANETLGPGREIPGVAFRVPAAYVTGTNLSADSALTVERVTGASACTAALFLDEGTPVEEVTEDGRTWSMGKSGDAGARNLYENVVHATGDASACFGLRLFVHSTQLANYDPGTRVAFDRARLDADYAAFRASFSAGE